MRPPEPFPDERNASGLGTMLYMESTVKAFCEGVGNYRHKPRTVAQFRYNEVEYGGWARVHNEGPRDPILLRSDGEVSQNHQLICDLCTRDDYYTPEQLYPELDKARIEHRTKVSAADIAVALK